MKKNNNPFMVGGHPGFIPDNRKGDPGKHGANEKTSTSTGESDGELKDAPSRKSPSKIVSSTNNSTRYNQTSVNNSLKVLSNGIARDIVEYEDDRDEDYDVEDDKYSLNYEEKSGRKTDRELSRLKWNGKIPNKGNSENLGRGQRSAAKKHK